MAILVHDIVYNNCKVSLKKVFKGLYLEFQIGFIYMFVK